MRPPRSGKTCTAARSAADREADDVDRADRGPLDRLALGQPLDRPEPVAVAGRVLEPLLGGGGSHLRLELGADRAGRCPERNSMTPSITSR